MRYAHTFDGGKQSQTGISMFKNNVTSFGTYKSCQNTRNFFLKNEMLVACLFCMALQRFANQITVKLIGSRSGKVLIENSMQQHEG